MDSNYDYDLFVIGAGSAGVRAATTARKLGARVGLADFAVPSAGGTTWSIGGTCINVGSVPKKLFHYSAQLGNIREFQEAVGFRIEHRRTIDWNKITEKVIKYIRQLRWDAKLVLTQAGVQYYNMLARFLDPHTIELTDPKKYQKEIIKAKNILISVGGRPRYLNHISQALTISSDDIFYLKSNPGKTLIVGSSYVGLECASFLKSFGNDVTVMVRSTLLRSFDQQAASKVGKYMEFNGIKFLHKAILENVEKSENGKRKIAYKDHQGDVKTEEYDTVIIAVGRNANTFTLNLDAVGVKYNPVNNKIYADMSDRTNIPHIYALGDCAYERPEFTPPAVMAGRLLAERLFASSKKLMNYHLVPTTIFTSIEYSKIGYGEEEAIKLLGKENIKAYHGTFKPLEWVYIDKTPDDICYVKMVCLNNQDERIIGLHYVGPSAGEVMQGFSVAINMGAKRKNFSETVGIHPTCAEEVLEQAFTSDQEPKSEEGCKGCGF